MSDIGLAGGVSSADVNFQDLQEAQSDPSFQGVGSFFPGTNIQRQRPQGKPFSVRQREKEALAGVDPLLNLLRYNTNKSFFDNVLDYAIPKSVRPSGKTNLGAFKMLLPDTPTRTILSILDGALSSYDETKKETTDVVDKLTSEAVKAEDTIQSGLLDLIPERFRPVPAVPVPTKPQTFDILEKRALPRLDPDLQLIPNESVPQVNPNLINTSDANLTGAVTQKSIPSLGYTPGVSPYSVTPEQNVYGIQSLLPQIPDEKSILAQQIQSILASPDLKGGDIRQDMYQDAQGNLVLDTAQPFAGRGLESLLAPYEPLVNQAIENVIRPDENSGIFTGRIVPRGDDIRDYYQRFRFPI